MPDLNASTETPKEFLRVAQAVRGFVEILLDSPQRLAEFTCTSANNSDYRFSWPLLERPVPESGDQPARRIRALLTVPELLSGDGRTDEDWSDAVARAFTGWLAWREKYADSVENLMSRVHRDNGDDRQRFMRSYAAFEKYSQQRHGANVDNAEHTARVEAVLNARPDDLPEKAWVKSALPSRRGKGQARLVHQVVANLPGAEYVVDDATAFAKKVAGRRGARSHDGGGHAQDDEKDLDPRLRALLCSPTS